MNRFGCILLLIFVLAAGVLGYMIWSGEESPGPEDGPVAEAPAPAATGPIVMPVAGIKPEQLTDSWGDSRGGGARAHDAIDIMAPRGTPVVAAAPGKIEKLFDSKDGGRTVYVRSDDGKTVYYYAHLDTYRDGLREGEAVGTGDVIGTVGSTGSASESGPHLHFSIKRMAEGERWYQGEAFNPYPLLAGKAAAR